MEQLNQGTLRRGVSKNELIYLRIIKAILGAAARLSLRRSNTTAKGWHLVAGSSIINWIQLSGRQFGYIYIYIYQKP